MTFDIYKCLRATFFILGISSLYILVFTGDVTYLWTGVISILGYFSAAFAGEMEG